jgi:hypothetical protein
LWRIGKIFEAQLNLDHNGQFSTYHTGNRAYHRYYHHIRETFTAVTELTQKSN